jgi:hypothetical protein
MEITLDEALEGATLVRVETFDGHGQTIVRCELRRGGIDRLRDLSALFDDPHVLAAVALAALARTAKKKAKG